LSSDALSAGQSNWQIDNARVPVLGVECVITAMDSAIRRSHNFSDRALVSCQQSFSQENRLPCSLSAIATGVEDRHWAIELEAA